MISGNKIFLRALEPSDLEWLYQVENDMSVWQVSNTLAPFSRQQLEEYIRNSAYGILTTRQLRLVISLKDGTSAGCIDLFDYDPFHRRAGIGILLLPAFRNQGYAAEALDLLLDYVFNVLNLNQVYCNISTENSESIRLFSKAAFRCKGTRSQWIFAGGRWLDENFYQLLKEDFEDMKRQ